MTNFGTILDDLFHASDKTEYIKELCRNDLLIIDDLNAERDTSFALEGIFKVIDERYRQGKPIVITSNLTLEEFKNCTRLDLQRIYDRILEMCIPVQMQGVNLREKKRDVKRKNIINILLGDVTAGVST